MSKNIINNIPHVLLENILRLSLNFSNNNKDSYDNNNNNNNNDDNNDEIIITDNNNNNNNNNNIDNNSDNNSDNNNNYNSDHYLFRQLKENERMEYIFKNYYNISNVCQLWMNISKSNLLILELNPFILYKLKHQGFNFINNNNQFSTNRNNSSDGGNNNNSSNSKNNNNNNDNSNNTEFVNNNHNNNNSNNNIDNCIKDFSIHEFFNILKRYKSVENVYLSNFNFTSTTNFNPLNKSSQPQINFFRKQQNTTSTASSSSSSSSSASIADSTISSTLNSSSSSSSSSSVTITNYNYSNNNNNSTTTTTTTFNGINNRYLNSSVIANRLSTKAALLLSRNDDDYSKTLTDLKNFYSSSTAFSSFSSFSTLSSLSNFIPSSSAAAASSVNLDLSSSSSSPLPTLNDFKDSKLQINNHDNNKDISTSTKPFPTTSSGFFSSTSALDKYRLNQILYENTINNITKLEINRCSNFKSIEFVNYFLNSKYLQTLIINDCNLKDWDCSVIFFTIKSSESLTSIDLSRNRIQEEAAKTISMVLKENKTLKSLILDNNRIGSSGLTFISNALRENTSTILQNFSAKKNSIYLDGALSLLQTLHSNRTLLSIDLSNNNFSSSELLKAYCMIYLQNQTLVLSPNVQLKVNNTIFNKNENDDDNDFINNNNTNKKFKNNNNYNLYNNNSNNNNNNNNITINTVNGNFYETTQDTTTAIINVFNNNINNHNNNNNINNNNSNIITNNNNYRKRNFEKFHIDY